MRLSTEALQIKTSPIRVMGRKAVELTSQGFDVINATIGEPGHPVDPAAVDQGILRLLESRGAGPAGIFGRIADHMVDEAEAVTSRAIGRKGGPISYTDFQGDPKVRERIARAVCKEIGNNDVNADNIVMGLGVSGLFQLLIYTITNPNEVITTHSPYFGVYGNTLNHLGRGVRLIDTTQDGYRLTAEKLYNALSFKGTFLLIDPCNPTGVKLTRRELVEIAKVLEQLPEINVISDEIYKDIVYNGAEPVTLFDVASKELRARMATLHSSSKGDAFPGERVGAAIVPKKVAVGMANFQLLDAVHPAVSAQEMFAYAFETRRERQKAVAEFYEIRMNAVVNGLEPLGVLREGYRPNSAFYLLANLSKLRGQKMNKMAAEICGAREGDPVTTDMHVAAALITYGVVVTPASIFGPRPEEMIVRIVTTDTPERLQELTSRVGRAINDHKKGNPLPDSPPRKNFAQQAVLEESGVAANIR